jgi:hypothetical protein
MGKTTQRAHLATRLAQDDHSRFGEGHAPLFGHAAALGLPLPSDADVTEPLMAAGQAAGRSTERGAHAALLAAVVA